MKKQRTKQTRLGRIFQFLRPRLFRFFAGLILVSIIVSLSLTLRAVLLKDFINAAISGDVGLFIRNGIIYTIVLVLVLLLQNPIWGWYVGCAPYAGYEIITKTMSRVQRFPLSYFEKAHSGDIVSRINADVRAMMVMYGVPLRRFVTPLIMIVCVSTAMFLLEWRVTIGLLLFNLLLTSLNTLFAIPIRRLNRRIQQGMGTMSARAIDILSGFRVIKIFQIEEHVFRLFKRENSLFTREQRRQSAWEGGLEATNNLMQNIINLGMVFAGLFLVRYEILDVGMLLAFIQLQGSLGSAFLGASQYLPRVQKALAGAERIFELLDHPVEPERYACSGSGTSDAEIEFRELGFCYTEKQPVLERINLHIPRGSVTAFVGPSGGGKTTLLKLLLGFYKAGSGALFLRGRPYAEYTLEEVRRLCAYVPQNPYLFSGSVSENILCGRPHATREDVEKAARLAHASEFITELPEGFATQIGERGIRLSGGQKQRIAIARALLRDAPILLLDEATSSLDSQAEQQVQDALYGLMRGRTSLIVAHRLSTVRHADAIHVIDKGRIVQSGRHEELLQQEGLYKRLYLAGSQDSGSASAGSC